MLEIQNFIIGFPIFDIYAIAGTEHALAHYVEYVYGRRLVGEAARDKVCLFHNIEFCIRYCLVKANQVAKVRICFHIRANDLG